MPKFQVSEFVLLRTLTVSDARSLFSLVDDNRTYLRVWLPWLDDNTGVEDLENFIKSTLDQYADEMGFQCGIFFNETLVGVCGYHPINRSSNSVTIGYWIAEDTTGKGIVTSCTKYLIDYAFDKLNLNKVCIPAAVNNLKSRAVPERLGLVNEGIEREAEYLYGQYVDHVRYSILRSEWKDSPLTQG